MCSFSILPNLRLCFLAWFLAVVGGFYLIKLARFSRYLPRCLSLVKHSVTSITVWYNYTLKLVSLVIWCCWLNAEFIQLLRISASAFPEIFASETGLT